MKRNNTIFRNLVKIAYINPKYRHELFCLLGLTYKNHRLRKAGEEEAAKIMEDAKQGVFSGYTLGVLSAFYTNKGKKFKNPNPEGGKDQIAMSTLAKYYSERDVNPEYKKFEGQTISEIQRAFNDFYKEFQKQKQMSDELKGKDENAVEDEYAGMTEEEIEEAKERELKKPKAIKKLQEKIKESERDMILDAKEGKLHNKIFNILDRIDPFREMEPEKEKEEVEKMYEEWESKFFVTKEDGKVYLESGIEDNEKTRNLIKGLLRDNLSDEDINKIFDEAESSRKGAIANFFDSKVDSTLKFFAKPYLEMVERNANLIVKASSYVIKKYEERQREKLKDPNYKIDVENPEFLKEYFEYLDEKYTKELNPEVRIAMRKNSKAMINILRNLGDKTGATELAKDLTGKAIHKIQTSEAIQKTILETKEFGKKCYEKVVKQEEQVIEEFVREKLVGKVKSGIVDNIKNGLSKVTGVDSEIIGNNILGNGKTESEILSEAFENNGLSASSDEIEKMISEIKGAPDKILLEYMKKNNLSVSENDVHNLISSFSENPKRDIINFVKKKSIEGKEKAIEELVNSGLKEPSKSLMKYFKDNQVNASEKDVAELVASFGADKKKDILNFIKEKSIEGKEKGLEDLISNVDAKSILKKVFEKKGVALEDSALDSLTLSVRDTPGDAFKNMLKERGVAFEKNAIEGIVKGVREKIELFKNEGSAELLDVIKKDLENLKIPPTTFEDSWLSTIGSAADMASTANNVYNHGVTRVARAALNAVEGDVEGIKNSFADDLATSIKKKVAEQVNQKLREQGLLAADADDIPVEEITKNFGVDHWVNALKTKATFKIDGVADDVLNKVSSLKGGFDAKIENLSVPQEAKDAIKGELNEHTDQVSKAILKIEGAVDEKTKKAIDEASKNLKESMEEYRNKAEAALVEGYEETFKTLHQKIEAGKLQLNNILSQSQGVTDEVKNQMKELEDGIDFLGDTSKKVLGLFGKDTSEVNDFLALGDEIKTKMRKNVAKELEDHLNEVEDRVGDFLEEKTGSILDSSGNLLSSLSGVVGSTVGLPFSIASKWAVGKFLSNSFYEEIKKDGGDAAVLHQKMLQQSMLPQEVDDDFRTKAMDIVNDSKLTVEQKIKKLTDMKYRYDAEVRPIIARALYQLGKRDATNKDIDGYFKQKAEYLKRGSEDEIDFSTFFIRMADDNDVLSDEEKTEKLQNFLKNKKNSGLVPLDLLIDSHINKMSLVTNLKKSFKNFRNGENLNDIMDTITGKKPIDLESYEQSKKNKMSEISKKKKKKKK